MDKGQLPHRSHLFTIRLWKEDLGDERTEYRGRVQQLPDGGVRYFRQWPALVAFLEERLREPDHENVIEAD